MHLFTTWLKRPICSQCAFVDLNETTGCAFSHVSVKAVLFLDLFPSFAQIAHLCKHLRPHTCAKCTVLSVGKTEDGAKPLERLKKCHNRPQLGSDKRSKRRNADFETAVFSRFCVSLWSFRHFNAHSLCFRCTSASHLFSSASRSLSLSHTHTFRHTQALCSHGGGGSWAPCQSAQSVTSFHLQKGSSAELLLFEVLPSSRFKNNWTISAVYDLNSHL